MPGVPVGADGPGMGGAAAGGDDRTDAPPHDERMNTPARKPLTIALMIETVIMGGAEMVVLQLAQELRSRGHVVHPVVPLGQEGWLLDRFREVGFEWHRYDLRRPIDPTMPGRLAAQLRELEIDVAHSHEFVMAVYGAAALKRLGLPHVITMHGNQVMTRKWQRRSALRWAFRRSTATVAVSRDTKRHLDETLGLRENVVEVIPNGIPVRPGDRADTRRRLGVADDELMLLAVGNLLPRKGHAVLLEALDRLSSDGAVPPWKLAIAGDGPERERLEEFARRPGLRDRVLLLGARNDVPDLQAAADVFAMPSLWEGLPLAILEAMFARNAIIASGISGIPEAITHDREGLLVPAGDVDALASALRRVLTEPALRDRLGQAALDRASREFTIAAMTDGYERLYRRA